MDCGSVVVLAACSAHMSDTMRVDQLVFVWAVRSVSS